MLIPQYLTETYRKKVIFTLMMVCVLMGIGYLIGKGNLVIGFMCIIIPCALFFAAWLILDPRQGVYWALVMGFLSSGIARYISAPWGLAIDAFLFLGIIGWIFKQSRLRDWSAIKNDGMLVTAVWFGYIVMQVANPEAVSIEAWFYAMRGIGFYSFLSFILVFTYFREPRDIERILNVIIWFSLAGTAWGFRQQLFGVDAAEYYWLWVENHQDEHILFGVLRVFSFYSDAGQFGASQAMVSLVCGILAMGPFPLKKRIFYSVAALLTFLGFAISGTRGALAVPAAGAIIFLVASQNFKLLISGLVAMGIIFYILKFTFAFQGVEQVRRMREAFDPNNPSLLVRLQNQKTFGRYLKSRPLGGGVGTAGFWGARFSPHTLLARTPTDSWYVKIWAETGVIGISLHLFTLGYFMGKGAAVIWGLKHQQLKYQAMSLYSAIGGVLLASYGNQVFGQMPTGMIMNLAIPFIFMAPLYEKKLLTDYKDATT